MRIMYRIFQFVCPLQVDEDLLRFLQTGCVEMEVFAKKKPALRQTLSTQGGGGGGGWLFHKVGEANFAYLGDVHEEDVLAATAVALKKQQELVRRYSHFHSSDVHIYVIEWLLSWYRRRSRRRSLCLKTTECRTSSYRNSCRR